MYYLVFYTYTQLSGVNWTRMDFFKALKFDKWLVTQTISMLSHTQIASWKSGTGEAGCRDTHCNSRMCKVGWFTPAQLYCYKSYIVMHLTRHEPKKSYVWNSTQDPHMYDWHTSTESQFPDKHQSPSRFLMGFGWYAKCRSEVPPNRYQRECED